MLRSVLRMLVLLATVVLAPSAGAAEFRLQPADTSVTLGDTFTLRVVCDAVSDLKGYQTAYSFPAARLQLLAITAGDILFGAGGAWFATPVPDVTAPADTAWLDGAMLDGSTHGPGVAAYVKFKALIEGNAPLACVYAEMRDSNNVPLGPVCFAGVVHVIGPTPASRRTWGRLKTIWR